MFNSPKKRMLLIFGTIGVLNTLLDLSLYLALQATGLSIIVANIISTSVALTMSYYLNKRFTFKPADTSNRAFIPFLAVTLTGLWILQPLVIFGVIELLHLQVFQDLLRPVYPDYTTTQNLLGKLAATPASLIWNFVLYKRFVFKSTEVK